MFLKGEILMSVVTSIEFLRDILKSAEAEKQLGRICINELAATIERFDMWLLPNKLNKKTPTPTKDDFKQVETTFTSYKEILNLYNQESIPNFYYLLNALSRKVSRGIEYYTAMYISEIRNKQGLTQQVVANGAGIAVGYYNRIEHGVQKSPSITIWQNLLNFLKVSPDDVFFLQNIDSPTPPNQRKVSKYSVDLEELRSQHCPLFYRGQLIKEHKLKEIFTMLNPSFKKNEFMYYSEPLDLHYYRDIDILLSCNIPISYKKEKLTHSKISSILKLLY